jgi:hypothetical protein
LLSKIQLGSGLIKAEEATFVPDNIDGSFFKLYADISSFDIQFLLITHVFATMYVAYNAFITAKVMYVTMALIYLVSVLQMFYAGARPFWADDDVLTSSCQASYNHPSLGLILLLFLPFYIYYCSNKKVGRAFMGTLPQKHLILGSIGLLMILLVQFFNYFLG